MGIGEEITPVTIDLQEAEMAIGVDAMIPVVQEDQIQETVLEEALEDPEVQEKIQEIHKLPENNLPDPTEVKDPILRSLRGLQEEVLNKRGLLTIVWLIIAQFKLLVFVKTPQCRKKLLLRLEPANLSN